MHCLEYVMMKVFVATKSPSPRRSEEMWISASRDHHNKDTLIATKVEAYLLKWPIFYLI